MFLRVYYEGPKLVNLRECLAVHLLPGEIVETLLEAVQGVGLCRSLLHEVRELAFKLDLKDTRVHKQLHCIGVEQIRTLAKFATEVFNLGALHRRLSKVENRLG